MTQSYFEEMGRKSLAPIDTTEATNLPLVADMTQSQAEITERLRQNLTAEFQRAGIDYQNQYKEYSSGKGLQDIVNSMNRARNVKNQFEKLADTRKEISKFYANMGIDRTLLADHKTYKEFTGLDPDVAKTNLVEAENQIGKKQLSDLNGIDGYTVLDPLQIYDNEINENLQQAVDNFELFINTFHAGGIKLRVGEYSDGSPRLISLKDAENPEEYRALYDELVAVYAHMNRDLVGDPGKFKRDFLTKVLAKRNKGVRNILQEEQKAKHELYVEEGLKELKHRLLNKDFKSAIAWVDTYKGTYGGSAAKAKAKFGDELESLAAKGFINEGEADQILDTLFPAYGQEKETTIRKYWPDVTKKILNGVRSYQKDQVTERDENDKASADYAALSIVRKLEEQEEPITIDQVLQARAEWSAQTGITDPRLYPNVLKNVKYSGIEDDQMLNKQLLQAINEGVPINNNDIMAFKDPQMKMRWKKVIGTLGGKADPRSNYITTAVDQHFNNKLGQPGRQTTDYLHTKRAAAKEYQRKYDQMIEDTGNEAAARQQAEIAVDNLLQADRDGKIDLTQRVAIPFDDPGKLLTDTAETAAALSKDATLIHSDKPMPGEERHLIQAAKYHNNKSGVQFPHYYTKLAPLVEKTNSHQLYRRRLEAVGILKKGQSKIPEEDILSISELRRGRFSSPATTYQIAQENEDSPNLFKIVADEYAISDKGAKYDHIRDQNGEVITLEKPLSQHTVGEVIELVRTGHTDFGLYGISNGHLLDLFESLGPALDLNETFDEDHQNALVLAMLRRKSALAQRYCSIDDSYRHLVTFDSLTRQEFNNVVGELPPYLQPENMLPACSKELVEQLLQ